MSQRKNSIKGLSLVEILVGGTILAIISAGMVTMLNSSNRSSRLLGEKTDLEILKVMLVNYVDCPLSFSTGGFTTAGVATVVNPYNAASVAANCTSTSNTATSDVGPIYFRLRRKTFDNSTQWLTDALDANQSARLGKWRIRASCSGAEQSMVIRAIPDDGKTTWADSKLIFGGITTGGAFPLCFGAVPLMSTNYPRTNTTCSLDVNNDTFVSPIDALQIINEINANGEHALQPQNGPPTAPFWDVNRNLYVDRGDAQTIIDCLNEPTGCSAANCNAGTGTLAWRKAGGCPWDVNNDNFISPIDALQVINAINASGEHRLSPDPVHSPSHAAPPPYLDVNGNGRLDKDDAQTVINYLNVPTNPTTCP